MKTEYALAIFSFGLDVLLELFKKLLENWNKRLGGQVVPSVEI